MKPCIVVSREVYERSSTEFSKVRDECGQLFDWLLYDTLSSINKDDYHRVIGAYLSADILELSSKTDLTKRMLEFSDMVRQCGNLKFLQVPSAGLDRPLYAELSERGVEIWDARGIAGTTVALSAFTGMLVLARNMHIHFRKQVERTWFPVRFGPLEPRGIENNTAVIVGMGSIGTEIARLCKTLAMTTIGVRRTIGEHTPNFDRVVTLSEMDDILPYADWVFLACPLTDDTFHLMNARTLLKMDAHAGLINVSRGSVVDEPALIRALETQQIRCAYLDVFETEPLSDDSPLWDMPNVILTPHAAGDAQTRYGKIDARFRNNILARYTGAA